MNPESWPKPLARLLSDAEGLRRETIGESGAGVWRVVRPGRGDWFLKAARDPEFPASGEALRLEWLAGRLPVPEVVWRGEAGGTDFLLATALPGAMACAPASMRDPAALVEALAEGLRSIHALPAAGCPFDAGIDALLALAEARVRRGAVREEDFDPPHRGKTAAELFEELAAARPPEENLAFCHGDYCLPNVIVEGGGAISGFVDWGLGGVSDPWRDWAIAAKSVARNLGERWAEPFAEACGAVPWDKRKAGYYLALYELL